MSATALTIDLAGVEVALLGGRAAWLPDTRTLTISDLHLGKSQMMRTFGAPMPSGISDEQLTRLERLIRATEAERVVVVGDLLHAPAGVTDELVERVGAWRERVRTPMVLVRGNHDRKVERVLEAWSIKDAGVALELGGVWFVHDPEDDMRDGVCRDPKDCATIAGHVHPAVVVGARKSSIKVPAFWIRDALCVLPAFSRFTGGFAMPTRPGDRLIAVAEGQVVEV